MQYSRIKAAIMLLRIFGVFLQRCMECRRDLAMRIVCPSVCLSVCQTRDLWQNGRKLCPHCYTTWKTIHPSFV